MDTLIVRDDEEVTNDHGVLEPTPGNDDDDDDDDNGVLEPTLENDDDDGVSKPTPQNDDDGISEPMVGMFFKTEQKLIDYYKLYGRQTRFDIMTQRSRREADGSVKYVTLGCARGGQARNRITNFTKPHPTTKTDCKAKINAHLVGDVLRITTIQNAHNHGLSPQKAIFFRCNRAIDDSVKRQLDINDKASIGMSKSFNALAIEVGGFEKLPFIDGGLQNIFWADACSRAAYEYFGDVVTFDTTYLTNRYGMPFAPFIGVKHHGQSILLGAGLISSENTETFVWLFETWLKCMDGRAPKATITNQDKAMKNAIAIVFPHTRHRYFLWHIMRKLLEKLGSHVKYKCGLKSALQKSVYDSQTSKEFEKSWEVFLDSYNLHENA